MRSLRNLVVSLAMLVPLAAFAAPQLTFDQARDQVLLSCRGPFKNHGQCVSCAAHALDGLKKGGQISGALKGSLDAWFAKNGCVNGTCNPTTCSIAGAGCGSIPNGCGGTLDCGGCTAPQTCGGAGVPNQCGVSCHPIDCAVGSCGTIPDGCGGVVSCGNCTAPQTCGGAGIPNQCGCTPTSCQAVGANCGSIPDRCGNVLDCGTCTAPEMCGGAGVANQCGCTPTTCEAAGATCATIPDGCGGMLQCTSGCNGCPPCPAMPSAPTTGLADGTATGTVTLSVPFDAHSYTAVSAVFVPSGPSAFQIVISDDPNLCHTLQTDPPRFFHQPAQYAYWDATFQNNAAAGTTLSSPFMDPRVNVVAFDQGLRIDTGFTEATTVITGEWEICNCKYLASGAGRFTATLCPGGQPIVH